MEDGRVRHDLKWRQRIEYIQMKSDEIIVERTSSETIVMRRRRQ